MAPIRPLLHAANRVRPGNGGVTLIELVISIVLLGILAAVGATMFSESFTISSVVNANQASTAQARYALERVEREIREVKFAGSAYDITDKTATKIVFGSSAHTPEVQVTICTGASPSCPGGTGVNQLTLSYTNLTSNATTSAALTDRVTNGGFTLTYCEVNGTTCSNAVTNNAISFVQIDLTVTDATSGQIISQSTRVALRNASSS